jgi:hypothetical protein
MNSRRRVNSEVRFLLLKITTHHLEGLPGQLADLDLTQSGIWVGVTEIGDGQSLSFGGKLVKTPEPFEFPKIAAINDDTVCQYECEKRSTREW